MPVSAALGDFMEVKDKVDLFDAAYSNLRSGKAQISLQEFSLENARYPDDQIHEAVRSASELLKRAYGYGDSYHTYSNRNDIDGIRTLEERIRNENPGFSDKVYERALDYGFMLSR